MLKNKQLKQFINMKKFLAIFITIISLVMVSCSSPIEINEPEINNDSISINILKEIEIEFLAAKVIDAEFANLRFNKIDTVFKVNYDSVVCIDNQNYLVITNCELNDNNATLECVNIENDIRYYNFEFIDKENNTKYICNNFSIKYRTPNNQNK